MDRTPLREGSTVLLVALQALFVPGGTGVIASNHRNEDGTPLSRAQIRAVRVQAERFRDSRRKAGEDMTFAEAVGHPQFNPSLDPEDVTY